MISRTKMVIFPLLLIGCLNTYGQTQQNLFTISPSKIVHSEACSTISMTKGPYFVDNENCVLLDEWNRLLYINIPFDKTEKIEYEQEGIPALFRIGSQVYLKTAGGFYLIQNKKLEYTKGNVRIDTGIFFNFRHGVYKTKGYAVDVLIGKEDFGSDGNNQIYSTAPLLDKSKTKLIYLSPKSGAFSELVVYDLSQREKELTIRNVLWFSLLPAYSDYIVLLKVESINTEGNKMNVAFVIINLTNGELIRNIPGMEFTSTSKYIITNFDINEDAELIAQCARRNDSDAFKSKLSRDIVLYKIERAE